MINHFLFWEKLSGLRSMECLQHHTCPWHLPVVLFMWVLSTPTTEASQRDIDQPDTGYGVGDTLIDQILGNCRILISFMYIANTSSISITVYLPESDQYFLQLSICRKSTIRRLHHTDPWSYVRLFNDSIRKTGLCLRVCHLRLRTNRNGKVPL